MSPSGDDPTLAGVLRPRGPIQFGLTRRRQREAIVVTVTGELDVLTAPKLVTLLDDIIRRDCGDVVIDLSRAEFIDSLGLHTLLKARRRLSRQSRPLVVICGDGPVRYAIKLTRLDGALGLVSSFEEYELRRGGLTRRA
jgi:anti-anti-sigma factor